MPFFGTERAVILKKLLLQRFLKVFLKNWTLN